MCPPLSSALLRLDNKRKRIFDKLLRVENPGVLELFKREMLCVAGDQKIRLGCLSEFQKLVLYLLT